MLTSLATTNIAGDNVVVVFAIGVAFTPFFLYAYLKRNSAQHQHYYRKGIHCRFKKPYHYRISNWHRLSGSDAL
jgi:hypothetical protein